MYERIILSNKISLCRVASLQPRNTDEDFMEAQIAAKSQDETMPGDDSMAKIPIVALKPDDIKGMKGKGFYMNLHGHIL